MQGWGSLPYATSVPITSISKYFCPCFQQIWLLVLIDIFVGYLDLGIRFLFCGWHRMASSIPFIFLLGLFIMDITFIEFCLTASSQVCFCWLWLNSMFSRLNICVNMIGFFWLLAFLGNQSLMVGYHRRTWNVVVIYLLCQSLSVLILFCIVVFEVIYCFE